VKISLRQLRLFVQLSRPLFLLGGMFLYSLGAAMAHYLGHPVDTGRFLLGLLLILTIQLMTNYLHEYYDADIDKQNTQRTPFTGGSGALGSEGLPRRTALNAAIIAIGIAAILASGLLAQGRLPLLASLVLLLIFLGAFFYSVPPVKLASSGYGELTTSLVVGGLVPTFGFAVQTGELHRLLLMSTAPLVALQFAMMLAFELPHYSADSRNGRRTLMVRLGWSTAMQFHDAAIMLAIVFFGIAFLVGLPWRVGFGALIALPLAAAQIWQMGRIRRGYPPRWNTLTFGALALFALTAYLELVGYLLT